MKITLTIILISLSIFTHASTKRNEKIFCGTFYAFKYRKKISKLPGSDKLKHCTISCQIARRCGSLEAYTIGYLKELADLLGMGTPDSEDIKANKRGIILAKKTHDKEECLLFCRDEF